MNSFLKKISKLDDDKILSEFKKKDITYLKEIKKYLDDKYHNSGNLTELNDYQYDILSELISNLDISYIPSVGAKIRDGDNKVELEVHLASLDKIKADDTNALKNWINKNKTDEYIIENKLDGVSCLYIYKNGNVNLYTRGDGIIGSNITHLLKFIKNIPKIKDNIKIRGELIIKKEIFQKKYSDKIANPRNMISGIVNAKTLKDGLDDIDFIAYEIISDDEFQNNPSEQIKILKNLGFQTVSHQIINLENLNVENLTTTLIENKTLSEYEIDGIVIQSEQKYKRNISGNPKYAFAFKVNSFVEAEVIEVLWNISKYKLLKPRIKIKPINLNGVNINYASGSNAKNIVENFIGKGSIVKITRSGDVIPFIFEVIKPAIEPDMPKIPYKWNENKVDIIVVDDEDNISEIKMISSFFSNMGIKNISDSTVEKIYNSGYKTLKSIFDAKKEDFEKIDGFQKTLAQKIYDNIHNGLKNTKKEILLGSASILGEGIGKRKIKSLFDGFPDILDTDIDKKDMIKKIINIEGFSDKTAEKIVYNIDNAKKFLKDIEKYVSYEIDIVESTKLNGKNILFSGYRSKDLEKEIIKNGGNIVQTVNKNLSILIVKDLDSNSSKVENAKKFGVEIIDNDNFVKKYL